MDYAVDIKAVKFNKDFSTSQHRTIKEGNDDGHINKIKNSQTLI